jgi:hypothetical protein
MGIGAGVVLVALGAILAFAVHVGGQQVVNLVVVGWILMGAGAAGILLSLIFWSSWGGAYPGRRDGAYPTNTPQGPGPASY